MMLPSSARIPSSLHPRRGFALIITVVLVAFLVLLVVSLATFTRVETVVSDNADSTSSARQNALMAANIALGELQVALGPDQRVSAPAVSTPAPDVLGAAGLPASPGTPYSEAAWNTFSAQLDAYWNTSGSQPVRRSPNWLGVWRNNGAFPAYAPRLVNWLVSGNERRAVLTGASHATPPYSPNQSVSGLGTTASASQLTTTVNGDSAVVVVGNYSASGANNPASPVVADLDRYVVVPKVDIDGTLPDGTNGTIGRYGWWVGDLGTKAALKAATAVDPNYTPAPTGAALESAIAQSTSRLGFESIFPSFTLDPAWSRVVSLGQIPFGPGNILPRDARAAFHDVAGENTGLLTDTARGGFRVDLSRNPGDSPVAPAALTSVTGAGDVSGSVLTGVALTTTGSPNTDPDSNNDYARTQPFQDIAVGGAQGYLPVVAVAQVQLGFDLDAASQELRLKGYPTLLIWNPYTADFAWLEDTGGDFYRSGYRYRVRLIYDKADNSNADWDAEAQLGVLWEDQAALGTYASTVQLLNTGPSGELPFFDSNTHIQPTSPPLADVTGREFIADSPGAMSADSINGNNARLRAGELALYRGENLIRSGVGTVEDNLAAWPVALTPPTPAMTTPTVVNSRIVLRYAASGVTERFVRIEVYARQVKRNGDDLDNATSGSGPHVDDKAEVLLLRSDPIGITLSATARSNASFTDATSWENEWTWDPANGPLPPGFFPNLDPLFEGAPGTFTAGHAEWLRVQTTTRADDDGFWDSIPSTDPRGAYVATVSTNTNNTGLPSDVETASPLGSQFGTLSDTRAVGLNTFPVLFESFRTPPSSLGQLGHLPSGTTTSSMLLGADPVTAPLADRPDIEDINNDTWDGFFMSTLRGTIATADLQGLRPANTRLEVATVPGLSDNDRVNYLNEAGSRPSAVALRVVSPLNVNSPSSKAWAALLTGGGDQNLTVSMWDPTPNTFYNRTDTVGGNVGRFRQAPGITWAARHRELYQGPGTEGQQISLYRNGHRSLAPFDARARLTTTPFTESNSNLVQEDLIPESFAELLVLAGKVSARERNGPYMSLADFVNTGNLELALANVPWWETGQSPGSDTPRRGLNWWKDPAGTSWSDFSSLKGVPSYLSQRDLMQAIAPVIAARSDTFVIRAYGEKLNPVDSAIESRAWCELVVRREANYVDNSEDPEDVPATLNAVNDRFGRRFTVVSFRWLSPEDI